jgi:hypothetical protein
MDVDLQIEIANRRALIIGRRAPDGLKSERLAGIKP